jgi:hypothetical protein
VRGRIDASNALEAIVIRLPNLAGRVRKVADAAIIGRLDDESGSSSIVSSADQTHLVEWSAAALECITLMLTTPAVDNGSRLDRVKSEIQTLIDRMSRAQEKLPQALQSGIAPVHDAIAQFGLGPEGLPDARLCSRRLSTTRRRTSLARLAGLPLVVELHPIEANRLVLEAPRLDEFERARERPPAVTRRS